MGFVTQTNLILMVTLLGIAPFILTIVTSYCKIIVVCSLIRNALGVQQVPPAMVLSGLAMILTAFIMAPVGAQMWDELVKLPSVENFDVVQIMENLSIASEPVKDFLQSNTDTRIIKAFMTAAEKIWPEDLHGGIRQDSMLFIVPSFLISELTKAFQIGFLLYLPFIAIDLIISNILLALGMMMVSPMSISLPFKLMLFVSLDGWLRLAQGLMYSYNY
ncbi:MAG: type III secretion system export apparatus subunit SctR [Succinivibrio sp.]|nr:type III secretion system export apparatus subunit SctR [Succinivibrio sp.]